MFSVHFALPCSILFVSSIVDFDMLSTRNKRQQNKRFFIQSSEPFTDPMIDPDSYENQTESRGNTADRNVILNRANNSTQIKGSQVDMHTLEKTIADRVQSEVDSVMITVKTRVQDAVMTVIENLVILRVELAVKSVNASSRSGVVSVVLDPARRNFA